MENPYYDYETTGIHSSENPYDYDFKFSMKMKRKGSVQELNDFFKQKNIKAYYGVYEITLIEVGGTRLDLSKAEFIYAEGRSDYKSGDSKDFFSSNFSSIFEYEGKFYCFKFYGGGSSEGASGFDKTEEITRELAISYNPSVFT